MVESLIKQIEPLERIAMSDDPFWLAVAAIALFFGVIAYARVVIAPVLRTFAA